MSFQSNIDNIYYNRNIDLQNLTTSYNTYCKNIFGNSKDKYKYEEKTLEDMPIIGEIILTFKKGSFDTDENPYSINFLTKIINIYQETINELFIVNLSELLCIVLTTPIYNKKDYYQTKIKLQFPYCKTSKIFLNNNFRELIIKKLTHKRLHNEVYPELLHDWSKRLEDIKDNYPLYGSVNNKQTELYVYKGVYGMSHENKVINIDLCKTGCLKSHRLHSILKDANDDILDSIEEDTHPEAETDEKFSLLLLPIFLSLYFPENKLILKGNSLSLSDSDDEYIDEENPSDFELCKKFISIMKTFRFKEPYILDIGKALYNITVESGFDKIRGHSRYLDYWKKIITQKSKDFSVKECDTLWETFGTSNITYKTLAFYAKIDNSDKYNDWHAKWCNHKLLKSIDGTEQNIADSFYRIYFLEYIYTGDTKKWYGFENNLLVILQKCQIETKITEDFKNNYERLRSHFINKKLNLNTNDRNIQENLEKQIVNIGKIIRKLGNHKDVKTILECSAKRFFVNNFHNILDSNIQLLGVKSHVVELTNKTSYIRKGKPEDYISMTTGVPYRKDYNKDHPDIIATHKYLSEVFTDPEIRKFVYIFLSSLLYGSNLEKKLFFFIGDTNGSKSIIQSIINKMMGDYYFDINPDFFAKQTPGRSGPNPQLAQAKNKRVAITSEPSEGIPLDGGQIKRNTGNDTLFARNCHDNGGSFKATFTCIISCNGIPRILGLDDATKRRCFMIPFTSSWYVEEDLSKLGIDKEDYNQQLKQGKFLMDPDFEQNNSYKLSCGFLWIAVQNYKKYKDKGLVIPLSIIKYIDNYWKSNDPMLKFINEYIERAYKSHTCDNCDDFKDKPDMCICKGTNIIKKIDMNQTINTTQLWIYYQKFWEIHSPKTSIGSMSSFVNCISSKDRLGKPKNNVWKGWKFINNSVET